MISSNLISALKENPIPVLTKLTTDDIADLIAKANYEYYHGDKPMFGDNTYDLIREYLEKRDPSNPVLRDIGAEVKGKKEKLPYNMASLDKVKDSKALERFAAKFKGKYLISDKLDGNSAMFSQNNGVRKLWSRGDGSMGQNLSHLIPYIRGLPPIKEKDEVTIRGEVIISKKNFDVVAGKFANARNLVAGILNSKKPDLKLTKLVDFVSYELISPSKKPYAGLDYILKLGFNVVWHKLVQTNELSGENLSNILADRRNSSPYEVDGVVVQHDEIHPRVHDNPKYAFAFKSISTAKEAEVIVTSIEWNISKDKRIVPVVLFNPVNLNGVNIQRATAHNAKFIRDNVIGPGSRIIIIRSGDCIPFIKRILSPSETNKPAMPDYDYIWGKSDVDIYITESDNMELALKNLEYFFKKLEIDGLGPGNIKKLSDAGFKSPKSILNITKQQLLTVEGFKEKSAEKLFTNINEKNKNLDCLLLMSASNTIGSGIGVRKVKTVTDVLPKIVTHRYIPTMQELVAIKGIEKTTAELFVTGLPKFWEFIDKNKINCDRKTPKNSESHSRSESPKREVPQLFTGEKVAFTGFRNKEWEKMIEDGGGKVSTSVSSQTTLLVYKEDEEKISGKAQKALDLGITVLSKDKFMKKYHLS